MIDFTKLSFQYVVIPKEFVPAIEKASSDCIEKLNLDKGVFSLQKMFDFELNDSESTRQYMLCVAYESGYVTDDGTIIKENVLNIVGEHSDRLDSIIDECNKPKYDDEYEAVYRRELCFRDKSGLKFKI